MNLKQSTKTKIEQGILILKVCKRAGVGEYDRMIKVKKELMNCCPNLGNSLQITLPLGILLYNQHVELAAFLKDGA